MHKIKNTVITALIIMIQSFSFLAEDICRSPVQPARRVILIVWDGAQRSHVQEMLLQGQLPNLQIMIDAGIWRDSVIDTENSGCFNDGVSIHTETGPAHATMLTGYNFPIQKNHANTIATELKENDCPEICPSGSPLKCYGQLGPNPVPEGYTFFERLREQKPHVRTGMITGKDTPFFPTPAFINAMPFWACSRHGLCGLNDAGAMDVCFLSTDETEIENINILAFLDNYNNYSFFLFAHYKDPDFTGHWSGEDSDQYSNALIRLDSALGEIVSRLEFHDIYSKTIIIVTTDHGFEEGGTGHHHTCADTKDIWIVANRYYVIGNLKEQAKLSSITPTLFDIFGMDKDVDPSFYGESLYKGIFSPPLK